MKPRTPIDRSLLLAQSSQEIQLLQRRLFLKRSMSLGAVALLSGCSMTDADTVQKVLLAMSRWNDRVQATLFSPGRLAPTYPASAITRPFPFNAFYGEDEVPEVEAEDFRLELSGLIRDRKPWSLPELYALPRTSQITRHICVEGWSAIGQWGGVVFRSFLERIGADLTAKYVGFKCADDYYTSIDMATALHPQTLLTFTFADEILPARYGFPMKLRIPTKLGFKNPKHIMAIYVTNMYPGGYWEDQGYNWFSGLYPMRRAFLPLICIALGSAVSGAEPLGTPAPDATARPAPRKPMPPDEPMEGGMRKEGMMKGDVRKAAEAKDAQMRGLIEQEEEKMPPPAPRPSER